MRTFRHIALLFLLLGQQVGVGLHQLHELQPTAAGDEVLSLWQQHDGPCEHPEHQHSKHDQDHCALCSVSLLAVGGQALAAVVSLAWHDPATTPAVAPVAAVYTPGHPVRGPPAVS